MSELSADERAALAATSAERRRRTKRRTAAERAAEDRAMMEEAIAAMPADDAAIARMVADVVAAEAPDLTPRTWYGMPAWARGKHVVCFFQSAAKFTTRYSTLGFNDAAQLDDGDMWPTAFALLAVNETTRERVRELVRRARGHED